MGPFISSSILVVVLVCLWFYYWTTLGVEDSQDANSCTEVNLESDHEDYEKEDPEAAAIDYIDSNTSSTRSQPD
eukprot:scaffold574_cov190-Amphora_coffeaeformis.AAC.5